MLVRTIWIGDMGPPLYFVFTPHPCSFGDGRTIFEGAIEWTYLKVHHPKTYLLGFLLCHTKVWFGFNKLGFSIPISWNYYATIHQTRCAPFLFFSFLKIPRKHFYTNVCNYVYFFSCWKLQRLKRRIIRKRLLENNKTESNSDFNRHQLKPKNL